MEGHGFRTSVHKVQVKEGKFTLSIGYTDQKDDEQYISDDMVKNVSEVDIPVEDLVSVIRSLVQTGVSYQKKSGKDIGFKLTEEKIKDGQTRTRIQF